MIQLIKAYLSDDRDSLMYEALCRNEPAWKRSLFETLRSNRAGAYENPGSLLTALETNPNRDNDEMRELRREVAEYVDENYVRCDWPYKNDDVILRGMTPHEKFIGGLACMEDGYAVTSSEDGNISIINYAGNEPIVQFAGHGGEPVNHIIYDRERGLLISSGDDFRIRLWNPDTQEEIAVLEGHENYVSRLALGGNRLLSASKDQTVRVWDLETRTLLRTFTGHKDWVYNLAISPDGSEAVSCSLDNNVLHWDIETGNILHVLNEGARRASFLVNGEELFIRLKGTASTPYRPIGHTVIWPRKDLVITAGYQIAFWNTATWEIDRLSRVVTREIGQLRVAGDVLFAVSYSIAGFDIDTGNELFNIIAHEKEEIKSIDVSPDGEFLLTGDHAGRIGVRKIEDLIGRNYAQGHSAGVSSILVYGEGIVLTGGKDLSVIMWNAETGEIIRKFSDFTDESGGSIYLYRIDGNPEDVVAFTEYDAVVINVPSRSVVRKFKLSQALYNNEHLIPSGKGLLSMSMTQGIIRTDLESGAQETVENKHCYSGECALSPDGKRILLCGRQDTPDSYFPADMEDEKKEKIKQYEPLHAPLMLYDIERRKVIREFWYPVFFKKRKRHKDKMDDMTRYNPTLCAWSPDGTRFAAVFNCGELMIWDASSMKCLLRNRLFGDKDPIRLLWMDDNSVATIESKGSELVVMSVPDGNISRVKLTESKIRDFAMRDDRRFIACDLFDECMKIYDLQDEKTVCDVAIPARGTAYRWDGDRLYVGTDNGMLHRFTVTSTGSLIERLDAESEQVAGLQS